LKIIITISPWLNKSPQTTSRHAILSHLDQKQYAIVTKAALTFTEVEELAMSETKPS